MFNEDEDWNDDQDAQVLSKAVLKSPQRPDNSTHVKSKAVGKKSLLRTLQTLGPVPEWQSDGHQRGSDSETEAAPTPSKRKKKRRKRGKQTEATEEQQENGDIDETEKEEKPQAKKRKKDNKLGASKANSKSNESKDEEIVKPGKTNVSKPEDTQRLSRKQWKNKMKSKKKCKNKFKLNQPEDGNKPDSAEQPEPNKEVKPDAANKPKPKKKVTTESSSINKSENNSQTSANGKEKKNKPQKSINTEEGSDEPSLAATKTLKKEKKIKEKNSKDDKATTESSVEGSKPKPGKQPKPVLSKAQILKRERLQKILETRRQESVAAEMLPEEEPLAAPAKEVEPDQASRFRSRMEQRLDSARFRYINELLYSTSSGEARRMFKQDPEAFTIYHKGYTAQVQRWPTNPVDQIISYIQKKSPSMVVADFGCGDCKIARSVKNKVHSFDLASTCDLVTVCDMAKVPLPNGSVDIAVFCLSLMGTNLADFLTEANRVLKMGGILKVAEVASRFENVRSFITALAGLGFKMMSKDEENTHFYSFEFQKTKNAPENVKKFGLQLRPCVYKKR